VNAVRQWVGIRGGRNFHPTLPEAIIQALFPP
jgi:hypothetical protein